MVTPRYTPACLLDVLLARVRKGIVILDPLRLILDRRPFPVAGCPNWR